MSVRPAKPWQILAITFTNKAAGELKERICKALGEDGNDVWASTFHSTCAKILRRHADEIRTISLSMTRTIRSAPPRSA